jgi:P2 family phage contractile tail tube protein
MPKITDQKVVPEVINDFNCYNSDGNRLVGMTASVKIAQVQTLKATISGAGIGGEYETPVVGHTSSISQEIPFKSITSEYLDYMDHSVVKGVTLRGAFQCLDASTGNTFMCPLVYEVRGKTKDVDPGTVEKGNPMNGNLTFEALYLKLTVDGAVIYEIDKLNNIFMVNGKDLMEEVRNMC